MSCAALSLTPTPALAVVRAIHHHTNHPLTAHHPQLEFKLNIRDGDLAIGDSGRNRSTGICLLLWHGGVVQRSRLRLHSLQVHVDAELQVRAQELLLLQGVPQVPGKEVLRGVLQLCG